MQGAQIRAQATSPTMVVNDTNATNTTNQIGYISFQRQGSERGWIGFGSVNNDDFSIRNVDGEVKILSDATITGELTLNSPNGYSTDGGRVASVYYSGNDRLSVLSVDRSSGSFTIGYGAEASTSTSEQFFSSFDNFSGKRSAFQFRNDRLNIWGTNSSVQTTVGSQLTTMTNRIRLRADTGGVQTMGQIRATGWYDAPATDMLGAGIEIGTSGTAPTIIAYNRTSPGYQTMTLAASTFTFNQASIFNIANGAFYIGGTQTIDANRSAYFDNVDASGHVEANNFKINSVEVVNSSRILKNITRADFANFTVSGTSTTDNSVLQYSTIGHIPEGGHLTHPYFFNDLANFEARGGTVTIGGLNVTPSMTHPFKANGNFASWGNSNYSGSTMTITLTNLPRGLSYGGYIGISFGNTSWAPASCKIEISTDGGTNWTTRLNNTSSQTLYLTTTGTGGTALNAIRFTIGQAVNTSSIRVTNIWAYNYNTDGMHQYFLDKAGGTLHGQLQIEHSSGNNTIIGDDGTYGVSGSGRYVSIGFGGNANGSNRIFAHNTGLDHLYIASATGRGVIIRTNGGVGNTFSFTSGGAFQVAGTTVLSASRALSNITALTVSDSAGLHNQFISSGGDSKLTLQCADANDAWINFSGASNEISVGYERTSSEFRIANHDTLTQNVKLSIATGTGDATFSGTITAAGNIKSSGVAHPEFELIPTGSVGNADIRFDGTSLDIRSNSSSAYLTLQTSTTERLKITNTGNFEFNGGNISEVGTLDAVSLNVGGTVAISGTQIIDASRNATFSALNISGDFTMAGNDLIYQGGGNFDIKHTTAGQNILFHTKPSGGQVTERARVTHDGNLRLAPLTQILKTTALVLLSITVLSITKAQAVILMSLDMAERLLILIEQAQTELL